MQESVKDRELQNLRGENERLRGLLSQLSKLSLQITATLDLPTVLQDVVDAACALTGATTPATHTISSPSLRWATG